MKLLRASLALALWSSFAQAQTLTTTSFVGSTGSTNVSNSAVNYFALVGIGGVDTTFDVSPVGTVTFVTNSTAISWTFKNFWCFLGAAPGTGKSYKIEPIAPGGPFANQIIISNSATSGSDTSNTQSTASYGVSQVAIRVTPSGTPTATTVSCYIEATVN